jgi:hypothetical protein
MIVDLGLVSNLDSIVVVELLAAGCHQGWVFMTFFSCPVKYNSATKDGTVTAAAC